MHIIRESFTPDVYQRITWAILSDGRSFFNTVLVEEQFRGKEKFELPTLLINKITDNVHFAQPINLPFYPQEWLITTQSIPGNAGGEGGGGGGGGENN